MAQFYSISICREKITVVFTGSNYFFYSNFFGLLAVASRSSDNDSCFTVTVGNRYTLGCSVTPNSVFSAVVKFINKSDNKYLNRDLIFCRIDSDLADNYLSINLGNY